VSHDLPIFPPRAEAADPDELPLRFVLDATQLPGDVSDALADLLVDMARRAEKRPSGPPVCAAAETEGNYQEKSPGRT
jgi:hypothetical protein